MILIDSGFLIALIDRTDELHHRAISWAKHLRNEVLLVSELVLVETYNFFAAPPNRVFADQAIGRFLDNPQVQLRITELANLRRAAIFFALGGTKRGRSPTA